MILVRFVLENPRDEDLEEIEDFKTEFEALLPRPTDYKIEVEISSEPITWPDDSTIVVFNRRE